LPSVLWHCWSGVRKSIQPVKYWVMRWHGYLPWVRYKWFAYGPTDATAAPSSLALLKSRIVFFLLVPAYPGWTEKDAVKWVYLLTCLLTKYWHFLDTVYIVAVMTDAIWLLLCAVGQSGSWSCRKRSVHTTSCFTPAHTALFISLCFYIEISSGSAPVYDTLPSFQAVPFHALTLLTWQQEGHFDASGWKFKGHLARKKIPFISLQCSCQSIEWWACTNKLIKQISM